jgi:hypothetical protein
MTNFRIPHPSQRINGSLSGCHWASNTGGLSTSPVPSRALLLNGANCLGGLGGNRRVVPFRAESSPCSLLQRLRDCGCRISLQFILSATTKLGKRKKQEVRLENEEKWEPESGAKLSHQRPPPRTHVLTPSLQDRLLLVPTGYGRDDVAFFGVFDGTVGDVASEFVHLHAANNILGSEVRACWCPWDDCDAKSKGWEP